MYPTRALVVSAVSALLLLGARPASAGTQTVCPSGCPYTQIGPAVAAAHDGDRITIGRGRYTGGITVDVSVTLVGEGPGATVIRGGGPVLTVGVAGAEHEPTVTIDGVGITGGVTVGNLAPSSGRGGGVYIPRAAGPAAGATVTIRNSVIRGNTVAPREAIDSGDPCCPSADSGGGGISNDGTLTLQNTVVSDNRADAASGLASNSVGGGILNRAFGTLTLTGSAVTGNRVTVAPPNGRFTSGAGIEMVGGALTVDRSLIAGNRAESSLALASQIEQSTAGGGIHVQENASATIRRTTISGNSVVATNSIGDASAFSGGLHTNGPLMLTDSTLSDNHAEATTVSGLADVDSGGAEINVDATVRGTRFTANSAAARSSTGMAVVRGGGVQTAAFNQMTISDSVISGNRITASTAAGSASVRGGGLGNFGVLTLRNTSIGHNSAAVGGPGGLAQGGGVVNGLFPDGPQAVRLTLLDSAVTGNTLTAAAGGTAHGGGLFTPFPVTLTDSVVAGNLPDQCYGC